MSDQVTSKDVPRPPFESVDAGRFATPSLYRRWNEDLAARYDVDRYLAEIGWPFRLLEKSRYAFLRRLIARLGADRMLDAGCGSGVLLDGLPAGVAGTGMDFSATNLARCRRRLPSLGLLQADLQRLPVRDARWPLIVCTEVIEHLPRPEQALREMARALKPEGHLLITIPNESLIRRAKGFLRRMPGGLGRFGLESGGPNREDHNLWHLHDFTAASFEALLEPWFEIRHRYGLPLTMLPVRWIYVVRKKESVDG